MLSDADVEEQQINQEAKTLNELLLRAIKQDDSMLFSQIRKVIEGRPQFHVSLKRYFGRILRVAAQYDRLTRLTDLFPDLDINEISDKGETALHSSAECGSTEAVKLLLDREAKWDVRNNQGLLPIHSAFKTRLPRSEIIRLLMDKCLVGPIEREPFNLADGSGNNPLHLAAIHMSAGRENCLDCLMQLKNLDPNRKNDRGDSPLHLAVKRRNVRVLEAMLKIFYGYEKDVENHVTDKDGNSLLDMAAISGYEDIVVLLLDYGADPRKGTLLKLVSESVRKEEKRNVFRRVYRFIVENVDKWSDGKGNEEVINVLNAGSEKHSSMNAIEFAIDEGAVELLKEMLHTEALYEFHSDGNYKFRVRYCCPSKENISLLERITLQKKARVGAEMLNIQPMRYISSQYLWYSTLFYLTLFVFQLIYMICFSCYCFPDVCYLSRHFKLNASRCNASSDIGSSNVIRNKVGFIVWPLATLILSICLKLYQLRGHVFVRRLEIIAHICSFLFGTIVILWFGVLVKANSYTIYMSVTAALFISGWLQTFYYMSYLGELYIFTNLVKEIILNDVLKLAAILIFVVIGFSFAIHSLNQTELQYAGRHITETVYLTLAATVNIGKLFDDTTNGSDFEKAGGNLELLRFIFILYVVLSGIILLNILIAMMSDTYQSNNKNARAIWKLDVLSMSLALTIVKQQTCNEPILPAAIAGPIIRSLPESNDLSDDTDVSLLPF